MPAPLKIIEERSVGPDLGADSIRSGVYAAAIGLTLVCLYMAGAYGLFGVFADIAVIFNLIITIAALSLIQATLTLPGIAGLLLSVGMSVDANILVNERIREETKLRPIAVCCAGSGIQARLLDHSRCQPNNADKDVHSVCVRRRRGEGICCHYQPWHHDFAFHRHGFRSLDDGFVAASHKTKSHHHLIRFTNAPVSPCSG